MLRFNSRILSMQSALLVALLAVFVVFFSIIPQSGFVYPHLINSGHAFVFGLGAYLLMVILAKPESLKQVVLCALGAFTLGILVELLQPLVGRQRSIVDAYYDLLGSVAAALWYISLSETTSSLRKRVFRLVSVLLVISSLAYPGYRLYIKQSVDKSAPNIADFEVNWWSKIMWANNKAGLERTNAPQEWQNKSQVGQVLFPKGARYPGISFAYLQPDWSSYTDLEFEVYSEYSQDFELQLRVHDRAHLNRYHDRFNRELTVRPGLNTFRIPLNEIKQGPRSRELDLKRVAGLMLFMSRPDEDKIIFVDNFRLRSLAKTPNEDK